MTAHPLHEALTAALEAEHTTTALAWGISERWKIVPEDSDLSVRDADDGPGFYTEIATVRQVDWEGDGDDDWISPVAKHIVNNDPTRALARLDAERRVLERHKPAQTEWQREHAPSIVLCAYHDDVQDYPCPETVDQAARLGVEVPG